jgi:hypothetical protein
MVRRILGSPVGWAAFLIGEWLVVVALIRWLVPDDLPSWLLVVILVSVVVVLTAVNVVIRRRFLRRWWEAGSPSD